MCCFNRSVKCFLFRLAVYVDAFKSGDMSIKFPAIWFHDDRK